MPSITDLLSSQHWRFSFDGSTFLLNAQKSIPDFNQAFSWTGKTNAFFDILMIRGLMEQLEEHSCSKKCECPLRNYIIINIGFCQK